MYPLKVLVTGGAGYIGGHTCVELLAADYEVVVVDNLSNSRKEALNRVAEIAGRQVIFVQADLRDREALETIFRDHDIDAVVHFTGLKAVGESTQVPINYHEKNICGTVNLCRVMAGAGVRNLVFSSSATVYGDPVSVPIRKDFPTSPTQPWRG